MPLSRINDYLQTHAGSANRPVLRGALLGCAATGIIAVAPSAQGVGLGEASARSGIGESFRVEIPLKISVGEQIDTTCIKLAPQPTNDLSDVPWIRNGKLSLRQSENGFVLVVTAPPVHHPAVMLGILVNCGVSLRRDYALLLDPLSNASSLPPLEPTVSKQNDTGSVAATKPQTKSRGNKSQNQTWVTAQDESLDSIAKVLYPEDQAAQNRFIRATIKSGKLPDSISSGTARLPTGTSIEIPAVITIASKEPKLKHNDRLSETTSKPSLPRSETQVVASSKRDRLLVSEGGESALKLTTVIGQRPEMSAENRAKLKTELQLIAALDEKNAQHIELKERIKQLEALRARLLVEAANLEESINATQSSAEKENTALPSDTAASKPVLATTSIPAESDTSPTKPVAASDSAEQVKWYKNAYVLFLLLFLTAGAVAAGMIFLQKRRRESPPPSAVTPDQAISPDSVSAQTPVPQIEGDPLMEPLTEADIWPEIPEPPSSATVRAIEGAIGPLAAATQSSLLYADGEDEHDSAVELADIMMSFGRIQGAAQTLADFIRANPKQAVKPWLKLLEVYRAANMRMEFEALTAQMNKTFNVQPVLWDDFEVALRAPESLESMEHISTQLCELWGQRECQAYLHQLLRDNRQGTRQGFPLAIVDEVLLLLSILESRLGPFKPEGSGIEQNQNRHTEAASTLMRPITELGQTVTAPVANTQNPVTPPQQDSFNLPLARSLDFDLIDMDMLSKTLHINLDELTEPPPPEEIGK